MKISIASSGLGHVARGVEAWAADLSRALQARGQAVTLFKGGGLAETEYERVIPCWHRTAPKTARLLRLLPRRGSWHLGLGNSYEIEQTTFALRLTRELRREKIDILHVQDPQVALLVQRARALRLVPTRTILAHGTEESLAFQKKLIFLQHLSPWHLEEARAAGVWKPTWTMIPNFIDTERFHPGRAEALRAELGIPADALVVLTVAAIRRYHKRIDYLIDEFARLRKAHPDLPAWLVIAGGWERETEGLIQEGSERLGERVRFLVRFPRPRMAELYRAADLCVLCSLREMLGIALLEAAASGIPCLVHQYPVLQWVVGPGGEALDMEKPGNLACALQRWLADPPARKAAGERAREYCVGLFSQDRVVQQILDYYAFVMAH